MFYSIFVPILTYGRESWVLAKRVQSQMQTTEKRFLRKIKGVPMFDKVRNTAIRESLSIESLLFRIEISQRKWFGHERRMPQNGFPSTFYMLK